MPEGGARAPHQISCAIFLLGPERLPFCQQARLAGKWGRGGGVRFPRWKGLEANPIALPGAWKQTLCSFAWNRVSGDLGLESWKSAGQPRDNPESRSARLWNYSQVPKGQAGFLGNPAVWGHIHTGAELCPEKIISHLRLVCVCAFGGGDGSLYSRSDDSHGLVTREESLVPAPLSPFSFPRYNSRGKRTLGFPTPSPPSGVSARRAQLPFGPGASS